MSQLHQRHLQGSTVSCILAGAVLVLAGGAAAQDRLLAPGDVVEMMLPSAPDLTRKLMIGVDGSIDLPVAGSLPAGGLTLKELAASISQRMSASVFPGASSPQHANLRLVTGADISVRMAAFRPVYVTGDVTRPGGLPYRPGLNARQAITLAGGYNMIRANLLSMTLGGGRAIAAATPYSGPQETTAFDPRSAPAADLTADAHATDLARAEAALAALQAEYEDMVASAGRDRQSQLRFLDVRQAVQLAAARLRDVRAVASAHRRTDPSPAIAHGVSLSARAAQERAQTGSLQVDLVIIRGAQTEANAQPASIDALLEPGDVLDITLSAAMPEATSVR